MGSSLHQVKIESPKSSLVDFLPEVGWRGNRAQGLARRTGGVVDEEGSKTMIWREVFRRVMAVGVLAVLLGLAGGPVVRTASAQSWPFPSCPVPLAAAKWSAPESPTRAIAAQSWFKVLQAKVPAVSTPQALMALGPNEPLVMCRVPISGKATAGLGQQGDVAVVVLTKGAGGALTTEEVARFDSSAFEVYLPPSLTADASPAFTLGDMGPTWPVVVVGATGSSDQQLLDALLRDAFATSTELVAMGPSVPDQPGMTRIDRLVVGDSCGTVGLSVRIQSGVLSIVSGTVPACRAGTVRKVLVNGAKVSTDGAGRLSIVTSSTSATLSKVAGASFTPTFVRSYRAKGQTNTVMAPVQVGAGSLRSFGGSDGCNAVSTSIAFSANRFVLDPSTTSTAAFCKNVKTNALGATLQNTTRTGTYARRGSKLTLTFADRSVAVLTVG